MPTDFRLEFQYMIGGESERNMFEDGVSVDVRVHDDESAIYEFGPS